MSCLKCGREAEEDQVFCTACLQTMANYPVEPDVPVQLPRRKASPALRKPPRRRAPSPEERVVTLSRRVRVLAVVLVIMTLLCTALGIFSAQLYSTTRYRRGQNYTAIAPNVPSSTPTSGSLDE